MKPRIFVIIKTHNDYKVLDKCIGHLKAQSYKDFGIVIMDSGSSDTSYLNPYLNDKAIQVIIEQEDVGFCKGNNIATRKVITDSDFILYLNPDAFLQSDFIEKALKFMLRPENANVGILTGKLYWFRLANDEKTNIIDSAGIFQRWYGRWYNRGMGLDDSGEWDTGAEGQEVPAACGALMFCRKNALEHAALRPGEYFDSSFYMYKDDIDISLRVREAGFRIVYYSELVAWHCRGWQRKNRRAVAKKYRLSAAKNEIKINRRLSFIKYGFSISKYLMVRLGF